MQKVIIILLILLSFSSCKSSKRSVNKPTKSSKVAVIKSKKSSKKINAIKTENLDIDLEKASNLYTTKALNIISYAQQFDGVKYRFGGTSKSGIDCSGLIFESFRAFDVLLPRISRDMAKQGDKIVLENVKEGDLLFFRTRNRRNDISHVGLVVSVNNDDIQFIHATTSSGVITSSINENYWNKAFAQARRIL